MDWGGRIVDPRWFMLCETTSIGSRTVLDQIRGEMTALYKQMSRKYPDLHANRGGLKGLIRVNSVQFRQRISHSTAKSVSFPHHFHSHIASISTPTPMSGRSGQASNSIPRHFIPHTTLIWKEASTPCRCLSRTELVRFWRLPFA